MDCDKYLELMSAALDGELTADERRELDSHLAVCPECAALYRNLSGQAAVLRELDCEVPADLKQRIMENLPEQEKPARRGKVISWKRWAPVAAAACLALVVALLPKDSMSMNSAEAPQASQAYAPTADAPRTPGAQPMPSMEAEAYAADSASTVYGGDFQTGGLVDPAEPTGQEPQPDAGLEPEASSPAEPPMSAEPENSPTIEEYCSFENPLSIRVAYGATPDPGAVIIGSTESLETYLARFGSNTFDGEGTPVPNEKLETLKEVYNEEFFRTRRLLCVVVESGSGSNRYEIVDVLRDSVLVSMYAPEIGTCDMAAWLLTAEVDTMFDDGDTLDVDISTSGLKDTFSIEPTALPLSFRFDDQRTIRLPACSIPEEGAVIIGSVKALNEYLNQFKSYLGQDLADVSEDLQQLLDDYGYDQFFMSEHLLCVLVETGRYTAPQLSAISLESVIVEQTQDDPTFANAHFLIVAEISSMLFSDGDTLDVEVREAKP